MSTCQDARVRRCRPVTAPLPWAEEDARSPVPAIFTVGRLVPQRPASASATPDSPSAHAPASKRLAPGTSARRPAFMRSQPLRATSYGLREPGQSLAGSALQASGPAPCGHHLPMSGDDHPNPLRRKPCWSHIQTPGKRKGVPCLKINLSRRRRPVLRRHSPTGDEGNQQRVPIPSGRYGGAGRAFPRSRRWRDHRPTSGKIWCAFAQASAARMPRRGRVRWRKQPCAQDRGPRRPQCPE
ncbi:hypothetical protein EDF58_1343 [Novosphingobium sp. PhB57]|nr:hypothetical protein EDF58_1343 [Novosphingobium sp. PhB57]